MLVAPGNNISIGGEEPIIKKPSDIMLQHRDNYTTSDGNPAVSPGGSSDSSSHIRKASGGGEHETPVSVCSKEVVGEKDDLHQHPHHRHSVKQQPQTDSIKLPSSCSPSSSMDNASSQVLITKLHHHDCIFGRGGFTNNYIGNANFRKLVNEHKMRYLSCNKIEKPKVARDVVQLWKQLDPPGRFLTRWDDGTKTKRGDPVAWVQCPDQKAQEKASQSLRERTPDVVPYLSKLQEHREHIREQGVSLISQHYKEPLTVSSDLFPTDCGSGRALSSPVDLRRSSLLGNGCVSGGGMSPLSHSLFAHPGMDQSMTSTGMNLSMNGYQTTPMQYGIDQRRMHMPTAGDTAGRSAVPVTPEELRSQMATARPTSMPSINLIQGGIYHHTPDLQHSSQGMMMNGPFAMMPFDLERQRQQVLQDVYSAVERHADAFDEHLFMERMMLRERDLIHQRQAMARERHVMQALLSPPFVGSTGAVTRDCDVMMPEHQDMMIAAAQKQQQLLHESMKDTIIEKNREEMIKQQQKEEEQASKFQPRSGYNEGNPFQVLSLPQQPFVRPQHPGDSGFDMEPLWIDDIEEDATPFSSVPQVVKSTSEESAKESRNMSPPVMIRRGGRQAKNEQVQANARSAVPTPSAIEVETPDWKAKERKTQDDFSLVVASQETAVADTALSDSILPLNDIAPAPPTGTPGKLKSAFKKSTTAVPCRSYQSNSSDSAVYEYRKALEDYMMNHQNVAAVPGSVDIDDDFSENEEDIGVVDASAWIQQALNSPGNTSVKINSNKRKKKRRSADAVKDDTNHDSTGFVSTHTSNTLDLMSTDGKSTDCGKSMDCKSFECMSFFSLTMSEMEKSMEQLHVDSTRLPPPKGVATGPSNDDDSDMLEDESINFATHNGEPKKRNGMSSNQSVMSELTDFSDNEDSDNDDGLGFERDIII
jgi:hypothetical protein